MRLLINRKKYICELVILFIIYTYIPSTKFLYKLYKFTLFSLYDMFRQFRLSSDKLFYINTAPFCYYSHIFSTEYIINSSLKI
jgi:hypothetical protein